MSSRTAEPRALEAPSFNAIPFERNHHAPEQLLRIRAVIARTGRSKTAIYTDPSFPKKIKISRMASAWLASEVDAWIAERVRISRNPGSVKVAAEQTA